ncbi:uncharacterized protein [Pocillopora verrucosa]|uniref:uncharacterized protein n=1 Tax=Pocillopora verrucosa TaxID=203993 RepID=UPI00333FF44B
MKECTLVEQDLKLMKDITDKLAAIGAPISEEDRVVTLLGSLLRSFATLITAIEARVDGVSLDYVQQALIHEEMKQSELSSQLNDSESALTGTFRRDMAHKRPTCFGCAKIVDSDEHQPKNSDFEGEDGYATAFMASVESMESTNKIRCPWIIDTGASSHMTTEKHVLVNFQEFAAPENVAPGDGRVVKTLGSGNV